MCKLAVDAIEAGCPGGHSIEDIDIENLTLQSHGVHVPPITGAASASAVDERFFIKLRFASDSGAASFTSPAKVGGAQEEPRSPFQ